MESGVYTLVVTDNIGCVSPAASGTITITDQPEDPIISPVATICDGETLEISIQTYSGTNVVYDWMYNSTSLGNNSSTLIIDPATNANSGLYEVAVTVDGCTSDTSSITITINDPIVASVNDQTLSCINTGTDLTLLNAVSGGTAPYTYVWTGPNGFTSTTATPVLPNVSSLESGVYTLVITDNVGCVSEAASGTITITDQPEDPIISPVATICDGETLEISIQTYSGTNVVYDWMYNSTSLGNNSSTLIIDPATNANSGLYEVAVTVDGCTSDTSSITITINDPIVASVNDQTLSCINTGTDLTLLNTVSGGTAPYTYVWTGSNGFTSTTATPVLPNVSSLESGVYTLVITDNVGCVSEAASGTITITDQPEDPIISPVATICDGETLEISIQTYSGTNVVYDWMYNSTSLGNNSSTLIIDPATNANSGLYEVAVTVDGCTSDTSSITITINDPIVASVNDQTLSCINTGTDLTLLNTVSGGTAPYTYVWTGPNGFTSTTATPVLPNVSSLESGVYTLVVTDNIGCASPAASGTITITDQPEDPIISPVATICDGETLEISIQTYSGTNVVYDWMYNSTSLGNNSSTLIIDPATNANSGLYEVAVTVDGCTSDTSSITITINDPIVASVNDQTLSCINTGTDLTLLNAVSGGTAPYTYVWTGPNGFTSTTATPVLTNVSSLESGVYTLVVTDNIGCASPAASGTITITDQPEDPIISPVATICDGETLEISIQTYSGTNVVYDWMYNSTSLGNNSSTLIIDPATNANSGLYEVAVTVDGCTSDTSSITITINDPIVASVNDQTLSCINTGTDLTLLNAVSGGTAPYTYVWTGPNGFTSTTATPVLTNVSSLESGVYTLVVTDNIGCVSPAASGTITITDQPEDPIISPVATICDGETLEISIQTYSGTNVVYDWMYNSTSLGNNSSTLIIDPATNANSGLYEVAVTVDGCTSDTSSITITINDPIVASVNDQTLSCINTGTDLTLLNAVSGGTAPYTYVWTGPNGFTSTTATPVLTNVSSLESGVYTLVVTDNIGCVSPAASGTITITDQPEDPIISPVATICDGETLEISIQTYSGTNVVYDWMYNSTSLGNNSSTLIIDPATNANSDLYEVAVTVDGCTSDTSSITITINDPIVASVTDQTLSCINTGTDLTLLNAVSGGTAPYTYVWTGPNGFTSTTATPVLTNVSSLESGVYTLVVTDNVGCASEAASGTITITDQPEDPIISPVATICDGETLEISIQTYSGTNVVYDWMYNSTSLGNNSSTLIIDPATNANSGLYEVAVTVDGCTSDTSSITITINDPIVASVNDQTLSCINTGTDLTLLNAVSGGTAPYTYVWTGPNGFTSTTATPVLTNVSSLESGVYTLVVTDNIGCASEAASGTITITDQPEDPIISPVATICDGETLEISIQTYSGTNVVYDWMYNSTSLGNNSSTLIIDPATNANSGLYEVAVTVDGCTSDTSSITITINDPIVASVNDQTLSCINTGTDLTLLNTVSGGTAPYTYVWTGPNGFTSTTATPVLTNVSSLESGVYTLVVTDNVGCVSEAASGTITITDQPEDPIIAPVTIVCDGDDLLIEIQAYSGTNVTYNWTFNSMPIVNSSNILIIDPATNANNGTYAVSVSVDGCTSDTSSVDISINDPIVANVDDQNFDCVSAGTSFSLTNTVTGGSGAYTYSWTGPNGFVSTDAVPVLNNITSTESGVYTLTVTDSVGCVSPVASGTITITDGLDQPFITSTGPACEGGLVELSVAPLSGSNVSYSWNTPFGVSNNITGSGTTTLTITPVDAGHEGYYTIDIEVDGCTVSSDSFFVDVLDTPIANPTATVDPICEGGDLFLMANASGVAPLTYAWSGPDGFSSTLENPSVGNVTTANNGQYTLTVTSVSGCQTIVSIDVNSILPPPEPASIASNGPICEGEDLILTTSTGGVSFNWIGPLGASDSTFANIPELVTGNGSTTIPSSSETYLPGTWQVLVTDGNGCTSLSPEIEIVINPIPVAEAFNNGPICPNEDVELSATDVTNGMYEWRILGTSTVISTDQNPIISGLTTTTSYELTVIAEGCISAPLDTTEVIVHPQPEVAITPVAPIECTDGIQNLQLDAVASNGIANYSFLWTGPNGFNSTNEDPILSNINSTMSGTYTVIATDANGCVTAPVSIEIEITDAIAEPVIASTGQVCEGEEVILSIPVYNGSSVSYEWYQDGTALGVDNNQLIINPVAVSNSGDYTVMVTVDGCSSTSAIYMLEIFEQPVATIAPVAPILCADGNQSFTLNSTVTGGLANYTYAWTGPNGFTSTVADPTLSGVSSVNAGVYTLNVTDANGCSIDAVSITIEITDGIAEPVIASTGQVCEGEEVILSIPVYNGSSVTYEWYQDGTALGIDNNQLIINPVTVSNSGDYTVEVIVDGCSSTSAIYMLEIFAQPVATIAPVAPILCADGNQSFTLNSTVTGGLANYTYAWTGPNGFTSTVADPTLAGVSSINAGVYILNVTDANGCSIDAVSITIEITDGIAEPVIASTGQVCEGEEVILSIPVYNGSSVTYEWYQDGTALGVDNNQLIVNPVTVSNSGDYTVEVIVDGCSSTSAIYTLEIFEQPVATIDPVAPILCADGNQSFTLNSTVTGGLANYTYIWSGPNGFTSTVADPTVVSVSSVNAGVYVLNVVDANGCISNTVSTTIEITDGLEQPVIASTGQVCEGEQVVLIIPAYNGSAVTYEWFQDGTALGVNNNQLIINPVTVANTGNYTVMVTADGCSSTSANYLLEIFAQPVATIDPVAPILCADGSQSFTLNSTITGGLANYNYSWTGPNGFTSTAADPTLVGVSSINAGVYTLNVTDANGCATDPVSIAVTITDGLAQPVIASTGQICAGEEVVLVVPALTGTSVVYEWFKDGNPVGVNNNQLIIFPVTTADAGDYTVTVTVDGCTATSPIYVLEIFEQPVVEILPVAPVACVLGDTELTLFSNVIAGQAPFTFLWTGPNNFSSFDENPTLVNINGTMSGTYSVVILDANGCESAAYSTEVDITDAIPEPVIVSNAPYCEGEYVTLQVQDYTGIDVNYQWTQNGNVLPFNNNEIVINPVTVADAGNYQLTVTVDGCISISEIYNLIVNEKPVATIDPVAPILCTDGSDSFTLNSTMTGGLATYVYEWTGPNGFTSSDADPTVSNITELNAGVYTLIVTDANGCVADAVSQTIIITDGIAQPVIASTGQACEGDLVTLTIDTYQGSAVTYEWFRDGTPLGIDNNQVIISPATLADNGNYTVTVTVDGCSATSASYLLEIFEQPVIAIDPVAPILCADGLQSFTLNSTITGGLANYVYSWTGPDGFTSTIADPILNGVTSVNAGVYTLNVTDANGCIADAVSTTVQITDGVFNPAISSTGQTCEGGEVLLSIPTYTGNSVLYEWFQNGNPVGFNNNQLIINPATPADAGDYIVMVTVDGCSSTSSIYALQIFETPVATIDPVAPILCTDGTASLTLNSTVTGGLANYTYSWTGPNGFTSTDADPTILGITEANAGTYSLIVTDANGCSANGVSQAVQITDGVFTPIITSSGQTCEGTEVILSIPPYSGINVDYEWFKDGVALGINNNQLIIDPATLADAGDYSISIDIDGCSTTSPIYGLVIYERPVVTIDTVAPISCVLGNTELQLTSNVLAGTAPITFEWSGPNGFNSFSQNPTLINITGAMSGTYSVVITDANGCPSIPFSTIVDISDAIPEPVIVSNAPYCEGEYVTLQVQDYVGVNVTYTWTHNGNVLPYNNNEIVINPVTSSDAGEYILTVDVDGCATVSDPYDLIVIPRPVVTIDSIPPVLCTDGQQSLTINSTTTLGFPTYTYTWTGPNGYTSTDEDPTLVNINSTMSGNYTVIVTDANGCISNATSVVITITDEIDEPVITSTGQTCEGDEVILSIQSYTGGSVGYSWVGPNGPITNNSNELILFPVTLADAGNYSVAVSVEGCTKVSSVYTLNVFEQPITAPTNDATLCSSLSADLQLTANPSNGLPPYTFSWTGPNGFASSDENPILPNADASYSGTYVVTISDVNGCSSVSSTIVEITNPPNIPAITSISSGLLCEGEVLEITTNAYVGDTVVYTWITPQGNVTTTNPTLIIDPVVAADNGLYAVFVTVNGCSSQPSGLTNIGVVPTPAAPNVPADFAICENDALVLTTTTVATSYVWTGPNGFFSTLQNPTVTNPAGVFDSGIYQLVVFDFGCPSPPSQVEVTVNPNPIVASIVTNSPICDGEDLILSTPTNEPGYTYQWIGPLGDDPSVLSNPFLTTTTNTTTIPNGDVAYLAGEWSVRIINANGCISESPVVNVTVTDIPGDPTASSNSPICYGENVELFAGSVPGATYEWYDGDPNASPAGTLISTDQNPVFFNVDVGTHLYWIKIVQNGCGSSSTAIVEVIVNQLPSIGAISSNGVLCEGDDLLLEAPTFVDGVYSWTGPNGFVSFLEDPIVAGADASNSGVYTLNVTVNGCQSNTIATQVTINAQPATPIVSNDSPACEGSDVQLFGPTVANGQSVVYTWTGPNGFASSFQNPTIPNVSMADTGMYQLVVTVDGCPSLVSAPTMINITEQLPAPIIANNSSATAGICEGDPIFFTTAFVPDANYFWTGPNGFNSTEQNPIIPEANILDTGEYVLIMEIDGCLSYASVPTDVFVTPNPVAPIVINSGQGCEGSTVSLIVPNTSPGLTYTWYQASTGIIVGTGDTLDLNNIAASQAGAYYAVASGLGCESDPSFPTQVIVNPSPNQNAFAGEDFNVCGGSSTALDAVPPTVGTGQWTTTGGAIISNPSQANSDVFDLQTGDNIFVWSLSNGDCNNYSNDTLVISVSDVPNEAAVAGLDQTLCGISQMELSAVTPNQAGGEWSQPNTQSSLGVVIVDPTDPNTTITGLAPGNTYVFYWSLSFGICDDYSVDEVMIIIDEIPADIAYAGEDTYHCGESPFILSATAPLLGSGSWSTSSGATIITSNSPTTQIINIPEGENVFYWTLDNASCENFSMDSIIVNSLIDPIAVDDIDTVIFNTILEGVDLAFNDDVVDSEYEITITTEPVNGTVEVLDNGEINYTPNENYAGIEYFEYMICNLHCPDQCDEASVQIYVTYEDGTVEEDECFVPSIITPNGDGVNDQFIIPCLVDHPNSTLKVYNRWGDQVYNSESYNNDWEGTYNDFPLPEGSYFYVLYLDGDPQNILSGYLIIRP